jgi:endonuclease/exonuclease/phosphatase (EEP) superfamily protein YafD
MLYPVRRFRPPLLFKTVPEAAALRLGTASVATLGPNLRVVCWNFFKAIRPGALGDLAAVSAEADLVLLQEAVLHGGRPTPLHLSSGLEWVMAETLTHARQGITSGPKTGCRAPALEIRTLRSLDYEPISGTPKALLLTRYPTQGGGVMTVINVHAMNFVPLAKFARQMTQLLDLLSVQAGPVLVGGDFNTWNPSRQRLVFGSMAEAGLARVPVAAPRRWRHLRQQLDHVFSRGLTLVDARPLAHIASSDHIPLRIEFMIA